MATKHDLENLKKKNREAVKALETKIIKEQHKKLMGALRKIYPAFSDEQIIEMFEKQAEDTSVTI